MKLQDFDYYLPKELIAQHPLENREASRLLVLDKRTGAVEHRAFADILGYMNSGDCLVLNDTRVLPARLYGVREGSGARVEFLLLTRRQDDAWEILVKPGKKAKIGDRFIFGDSGSSSPRGQSLLRRGELIAEILDIVDDGKRLARFEYDGIFEQVLERLGEMPLPPYITEELQDKERYQTVYAAQLGAAAAPTAGLHFTDALLHRIAQKGVHLAYITLHVGLGTFRPVSSDNIEEHKMHEEFYSVSHDAAEKINAAKSAGRQVVAVGTTTARTLESVSRGGFVEEGSGQTGIFIYPPYEFKIVDKMITNFHLPKSTLIMLVSAMAGRQNVLRAYDEAVRERYRFFSFGDAMMIV